LFFDDLDVFGMVYYGRFGALTGACDRRELRRLGLHLGHDDVNVVVREVLLTFEQPIACVGTVGLDPLVRVARPDRRAARLPVADRRHRARAGRSSRSIRPPSLPAPWTELTRRLVTENLLVLEVSPPKSDLRCPVAWQHGTAR
jgi:hypothetical protein